MNIQYLIDNNRSEIAQMFNIYGIHTPVNYDTLSAAIALHSTPNGNPFLADLLTITPDYDDYDDYDELFGLGKKAKARRAERKANGEATGVKRLIGQVGRAFKKKDKISTEQIANDATKNKVTKIADNSEVTNDGAPTTKIGGIIDTISGVVNNVKDIKDQLEPGSDIKEEAIDDTPLGSAEKWYKNPLTWVAIGGGVLVLIIGAVLLAKKK